MENKSIWLENCQQGFIQYPSLNHDLNVDIAIIGGGITGITTAFNLINSGKTVCILEKGKIAEGTSGFSTGNLYAPIQSLYSSLDKLDSETIISMIRSRKYAIDWIEKIIQEYNIENTNFLRRPLYMFTNNPENEALIEKEVELLQKADIEAEFINELPIDISYTKAAIVKNQARFNPAEYLLALAHYINNEENCQIYENTHVISIKENNDQIDITTENTTVTADKVFMATHMPLGVNVVDTIIFPYRSYSITTKLSNYPKSFNGHFWDIDNQYTTSTHNIFSKELDTIIISGSHHKTGQPESDSNINHKEALHHYLSTQYNIGTIDYQWSAQHYRTSDGTPYIGKLPGISNSIYMATGYATDGLIYGTVAGHIMADMLNDKSNEWSELYTIKGVSLSSLKKTFEENTNVLSKFLKDRIKYEDINIADLGNKRDEGKIIKHKGEEIGVYIDENGLKHIVSAVCPHMKCIVRWNNFEKTWDCPCHGSRFAIDGSVIEGPSYLPLKKIIDIGD